MRKGGIVKLSENEKKARIPVWFYPSTTAMVNSIFKQYNFKSSSEFIEEAVRFYTGYLGSESAESYLTLAVSTALTNAVELSEQRIRRVLYKQAVELAMVENLLISLGGYTENDVAKLKGTVEREVRKLNGNYSFLDAAKYQNGTIEKDDK